MVHRIVTWTILIWTALMAVGILAAFLGIGGDCAGLTGSEFDVCRADAWVRGGVGLSLLFFLWLVVLVPMAIVWLISRPTANVTVFGPAGQQVLLSEDEARKRIEQQGWSYQKPQASEASLHS